MMTRDGRIDEIEKRVVEIEKRVVGMQADFEEKFSGLQKSVGDIQKTMVEHKAMFEAIMEKLSMITPTPPLAAVSGNQDMTENNTQVTRNKIETPATTILSSEGYLSPFEECVAQFPEQPTAQYLAISQTHCSLKNLSRRDDELEFTAISIPGWMDWSWMISGRGHYFLNPSWRVLFKTAATTLHMSSFSFGAGTTLFEVDYCRPRPLRVPVSTGTGRIQADFRGQYPEVSLEDKAVSPRGAIDSIRLAGVG